MSQFFQEFQGYLLKDENILWTGQPEPSVIFNKGDIYMIPISLFLGGFVILWGINAMLNISESGNVGSIFSALFGIPIVLLGLYLIFGRFILKINRKRLKEISGCLN